MFDIIKAHAYGNDFLFAPQDQVAGLDLPRLARAVCERHTGIGADGLILYRVTDNGAVMRLLNADGSPAEVSGNGVRCLGGILIAKHGLSGEIVIQSDGGEKRLTLLESDGNRHRFRAAMGAPSDIRTIDLEAAGERLQVVGLWMGNPQCVLIDENLPDADRFARLGPALEHHATFPNGTNVEFARVEAPDTVRIVIWERGVGPTMSSGTGSCAAAVAAMRYAGALRDLTVHAPGGAQRVEWRDDGVYLTGWAEIVLEGRWIGAT